jgi:23S rRNA (guanosine2251-2'-O)-methyltransferase
VVAFGQVGTHIGINDILAHKGTFSRLLVLDHIEDPFNFGGILRSAEAMGISAVLYPKNRNSTLTHGVIQAASGAVHHIPLVRVTNVSQALITLKKGGYWVYGADSNRGEDIRRVRINDPYVIVMGSEAKGISPLVQKQLDVSVKIPLTGKVGSLNVSVATGIMIYEFSRGETGK